jgi:hypothetical protein
MNGLTYDAGALLAAEAHRIGIWAMHRRALERGIEPVVPAGVLAQAWRGGPQPLLSRLLHGCVVEPLNESQARKAGQACGLAATNDVVDAAVVVGALARGHVVVTSDPDDLLEIAEALGGKLMVRVV